MMPYLVWGTKGPGFESRQPDYEGLGQNGPEVTRNRPA